MDDQTAEDEDVSWTDTEDGSATEDTSFDTSTTPFAIAWRRRRDRAGAKMMIIIDRSGIHHIGITSCRCEDAKSIDMQLLEAGIYPATQKDPRTGFTFAVLDEYLIENRECKVSASNFYNKLRRMTSNAFPQSLPDRYRELLRVSRQWRDLKYRKWHGFGFRKSEPGPGELAIFCPACPQPGINLPNNWREDPEQYVSYPDSLKTFIVSNILKRPSRWVYMRSFVMDGNFSAEHMKMRQPRNDVPLSHGAGYMVAPGPYKTHLAVAQEDREVRNHYRDNAELRLTLDVVLKRSKCNNHRAVNQANANRSNLEATGIGATACARHGCFCPHSVVDFQKGER